MLVAGRAERVVYGTEIRHTGGCGHLPLGKELTFDQGGVVAGQLPVKRIVCLANSRKMSGRCIAGIELLGDVVGGWIRPVSDREHEEVDLEEQRYEDGDVPHLLDVIDVPLVAPRPRLHQPENWLLNKNFYWAKTGTMDVGRLSFLAESQDGGTRAPLWIDGYHTYNGLNDEIPTSRLHEVRSSLRLIEVPGLEVHVYRPGAAFGNPKRRVQAHFRHLETDYKLWITDPHLERRYLAEPDGIHELGHSWLTVSIGEPYLENCYKLVAAVIGQER
jgi:hypothetical protein